MITNETKVSTYMTRWLKINKIKNNIIKSVMIAGLLSTLALFLNACTTDKVGDLRAFSSSAALAQFSVERLPSMQVPKNFNLAPANTVWTKVYYEDIPSQVYTTLFHQPLNKPSDGFTASEKLLLTKAGVTDTSVALVPQKIKDDNTPYTRALPAQEALLATSKVFTPPAIKKKVAVSKSKKSMSKSKKVKNSSSKGSKNKTEKKTSKNT